MGQLAAMNLSYTKVLTRFVASTTQSDDGIAYTEVNIGLDRRLDEVDVALVTKRKNGLLPMLKARAVELAEAAPATALAHTDEASDHV